MASSSESSAETHTFTEVEEVEQANREAGWDLEYRQLVAGNFSAQYAVQQCSKTLLMRERYGCDLEVQGTLAEDAVTVIIPQNPDKSATLNGEEVICGQMYTFPPGAEVNAVVLGGLKLDSFYLPKQALHRAINTFNPSLASTFASSPLRLDVGDPRFHRLQQTFTALLSADQESISRRELEASLALHTAELIAGRQGKAIHSDISQPIAPKRALNRAREYIEANLQKPLTMANICSYAEIRIRSLQRVFLRELDLTPTQYILARRLNSVRRQLISSEGATRQVTDIAFDHGFSHPSRFAVQYRIFFGETPRQTLQKRPRL